MRLVWWTRWLAALARSLLAVLLLAGSSWAETGRQGPRVGYTLQAELRPAAGHGFEIHGQGTVTVTNNTPQALTELPWHLYINAFREGSLASHSPFLEGRAAQAPGTRGSIEVERLVDRRSGAALTLATPSADTDATTASAQLATPIGAGETASFELTWIVHLPQISQRTGYSNDFVFAGQWFPKLAKLEPDGSWVQFPFHPQAEFYANFGDYDVTLDVPPDVVVGATGDLATDDAPPRVPDNASPPAGMKRLRYVARDVHDFAWVAWPGFVTDRVVIDGVRVILLTPPGHDHNRTLTLRTLEQALPWMSEWLGGYPFTTLTVVHPPETANGAGGMEYPGLITTGGARQAGYLSADIEEVVLHELAHQWFYGSVASNEHAWPFLDEGLATYVETRAADALAHSAFDVWLRHWEAFEQHSYAIQYGQDVAIATSGPAFPSYSHLAAVAYDRAALLFETCSRSYGAPFDDALRRYVHEFRQRHPSPTDLLTTVSAVAGPAAAETLRVGLFERGHVNVIASALESRRAPDGQGYVSRVLLTRHGNLVVPTTVALHEPGRAPVIQTWDATQTTKVLEYSSAWPLDAVCVDPGRQLVIEETRADNCVRTRPASTPRYWGVVLGWLQTLLVVLAW